ncbi:MAG: cytochrome c family protein [Pacificimonas sp.]|nr:cytochrome c family protein [Pacificimonas sp.]
MDSFEWNKIMGWVLAAAIAVLGLSIVTGYVYDGERPEEMGYFIDVPEDAGAAAVEVDPMVEFITAMQDPDVAKGEAVFRKCATCHTVEQGGENKLGPNLYGILGKDIASVPGFSYSNALQEEPGDWSYELFNAYMRNPRGTIPGNVMSFAGLSKVEDRANLVAYLLTYGGGPDLPAMPVIAEETDPEGTGPEEAKADDGPIAELADAEEVPESNIGGPAAENQDTTDAEDIHEAN